MSKIKVYYKEEMIPKSGAESFSKSPFKPKLLIERLFHFELQDNFYFESNWDGFTQGDFATIHTQRYVDQFFIGQKPLCESNGIPWGPDLADAVRYTNASLYNAILGAIKGKDITLSPTSGFHHAMPGRGLGFCTFAGQVLASYKIFQQSGMIGAYIDLDGHLGNSIEDFKKDPKLGWITQLAIAHNINPEFSHEKYIENLKAQLLELEKSIANKTVDYIVFCHGADSHEWDEGWNPGESGQCSTSEWIECSKIVYQFVMDMREKYNRYIPLTLSLFGGYRTDDYNQVLNLHCKDLIQALNICCGTSIEDNIEVVKQPDIK
jgi:acetoin utilization deacetylase AcuC-like enzyme